MKFFSHLFGYGSSKEAKDPKESDEAGEALPKECEDKGHEPEDRGQEPDPWPEDPEAEWHEPPQPEVEDLPPETAEYPSAPPEFEYLAELLTWRLRKSFGTGVVDAESRPAMPDFSRWQLLILPFIKRNGRHLHADGRSTLADAEATLLLLALAPHVQPELLDRALQSGLPKKGEFPQLGGIRPDGHNFRGFLPTGETALFLLGDDDYEGRMAVRQLFDADHFFGYKKILWLEQLPPGEPVLSGKIIVSQDYVDSFVTGKPSSPHFGASFPAKRITEGRTREKALVLSAELTRQVDDIRNWVDNNNTLLYDYKMEDRIKKGYRALFYGPPGTGKTLTAGILGNELKRDVYKIDISMVVSKYIGETEKNLELLFARAEDKGWILFFDEADALFGKRTDVKDAQDKYANQEASYLLQRIEDYDGLIILATNKKNNIDEAFVRRFNAILRFPFPDSREREEIWKKSLPEGARFVREIAKADGADEDVDESAGDGVGERPSTEPLNEDKVLKFLRRYELSGANIMNVVHDATLKAAQRVRVGRPQPGGAPPTIHLNDLMAGIKKELTKENRPYVEIKGAEKLVECNLCA